MLYANEPATLVRHTASRVQDRYVCVRLDGVSWYTRRDSAVGPRGETPRLRHTVRIPEEALGGAMPQTGDYLVRGDLESCAGPQDLLAVEHFLIQEVTDNRRGHSLRHVAVRSYAR